MGEWVKTKGSRRRFAIHYPPSSIYYLFSLCLIVSCASPRPPTGGPPDQTPPSLEATTPEAGAVNVTRQTVRLEFSEYVDQASFAQALSVTPAIDGQLDIDWSRRSVEIRFPEPLRENTTYVLTIDTSLRDAHNVALTQPITLAFSTGPVINQGRLAGRVVEAQTGTGVAGYDVLAYAVADSIAPGLLPETPAYRTQTDQNGAFQFSYMNEQPYFVIALQDRNRNRYPDADESFAVPPRPTLQADSTQTTPDARWLVTTLDTLPPEPQRIRSYSSRRLGLRFSEDIHLLNITPSDWTLEDSLSGTPAPIQALYMQPDNPRQVFVLTDSLPTTPHRLRPAAIADSSGNHMSPDALFFTPSTTADTLRLRFLHFLPRSDSLAVALPPNVQPGLQFNQPVSEERLHELVSVEDTMQQAVSFTTTTENNTTYRLTPSPVLQPDQPIAIRVNGRLLTGADTVYTQSFQRLSDRALGALSGVVAAKDTSGAIMVELYATDTNMPKTPFATTHADATGTFLFEYLPQHTYRFRAFVDRNGNGRWDGGQITPYRPAEPLTWSTTPPAWRARWESALADTLRIE